MLALLLLPLLVACGGDADDSDDGDDTASAAATGTSFTSARPNTISGAAGTAESAGTPGAHDHEHDHAAATTPAAGDDATGTVADAMEVIIVPSELVVGPNRFAVGLLGADGGQLDATEVEFVYYDLSNAQQPVEESSATATRLATPDDDIIIWVQQRDFARAGDWGVQINATTAAGSTLTRNIAFAVQDDSDALLPGEKAPDVDSPTLASVDNDLALLTSASEPDQELYTQTIGEALESGRPTLVLFATPAYCQTRFCGPDYDIVHELRETWGEQVNMIHVEVYSGLPNPVSNDWALADAMTAFGVTTEPWLYLIDADGVVQYRVEGLFTYEEINTQIEALISE